MSVRAVGSEEMKALDLRASREFGIPGLLLMENAGRSVADLICSRMQVDLSGAGGKVLILCGRGNNGGDGFVIARHLANRSYPVQVVFFGPPEKLSPDAAANFAIVRQMGIPVADMSVRFDPVGLRRELGESVLVVDALFGIGPGSDLREPFPEVIGLINRSGRRVVAVDIPSGLDADTGRVLGAAVRACLTAAMGLPKKGLYENEGPDYAGEVVIMDIGLPRQLLALP